MKTYLILALCAAAVSLTGAILLAFAGKKSEGRLTVAAMLAGLCLFFIAFSLCLGFFMV